jgi:pyruvate formate lyase activating enzyme
MELKMKEAMLYQKDVDNKVHCFLCSHHCRIGCGKFGFCKVRQNIDGTLFSHSYGKLIAQQVDPIEKKPLYHFYPGTSSFSIATKGCNFTCGFCQNWQISQTAHQRESIEEISAEYVVDKAIELGCKSISCTYTEPTIYFEYAYEVCKISKSKGLSTVFVTNGYMTEEALQTIRPYLDACNIDLKSFNDSFYRNNCSARLKPVLQTIRDAFKADLWIEITTLVIPGENDSEKELTDIANFIAELSPDIPWHISRFFPQYEFAQGELTTKVETIELAKTIGKKAGLRYVYSGNVAEESNTVCYSCKNVIVQRDGYHTKKISVSGNRCLICGTEISGRW